MPKMKVYQLIHHLEKLVLDTPESEDFDVYLPDGDELWGASIVTMNINHDAEQVVELY